MSTTDRLIELITPLIAPLGYELVHLEVLTGRQKTLRIYIDRADGTKVGIADCVKVTKAIDEPLDAIEEVEAAFKGAYELEVSSPGVDRPLRLARDFARFAGKEARVNVFRPLTAEELGNAAYQARNPKQKNFVCILRGMKDEKLVRVAVGPKYEDEVTIPVDLISKANLEPKFDEEESA